MDFNDMMQKDKNFQISPALENLIKQADYLANEPEDEDVPPPPDDDYKGTAPTPTNMEGVFRKQTPWGTEDMKYVFLHTPPIRIADAGASSHMRGPEVTTNITMLSCTADGQFKEQDTPLLLTGVTVIAARTGSGKTLTLTSLAAYLATIGNDLPPGEYEESKKPNVVVFISLEESADRIYNRLLASYGRYKGIQAQQAETGAAPIIPTHGEIKSYIKQLKNKTPEQVFIKDRDGISGLAIKKAIEANEAAMSNVIPQIWSADRLVTMAQQYGGKNRMDLSMLSTILLCIKTCREKFEAEGKQPLFFIDYTQCIKCDLKANKGGNAYLDLKVIMHALRDEGMIGAKIFLAAQTNRDNAKASKGNAYAEFYSAISEQMRESADIEQSTDTLIYITQDNTNEAEPRMLMRTTKNREGRVGSYAAARIHWDTRTVDLTDICAPKRPPKDESPTKNDQSESEGLELNNGRAFKRKRK